jgi:cytochrome P450 family 628
VDKYINILARQVAGFESTPINVSKWFNYFSFDVMGELAFAHSFDLLETGKRHEVLDMLEKGQMPLGFLGMLPWLFNFLSKVPGVSADYNRWLAYCENLIMERQKVSLTTISLPQTKSPR